MKEINKKILKIIQALIVAGGSFLTIFLLDHYRANFWDYFLVVIIFISLTSVWFIFKNEPIRELKKIFSDKNPVLSRIFNVLYLIVKGWLIIIFLIIILVWAFRLMKDNFLFDRKACVEKYLIEKIPTIDTNAYIKDYMSKLYIDNIHIDDRFKSIAIFAIRDLEEIKNIAENERKKYSNRGIYYGEPVTRIRDLTPEIKEDVLQDLDTAVQKRMDITRALNICVKN